MDWLDTFPYGTPKEDAGVEYTASYERQMDKPTEDSDSVCVCGVARSEHALCGCEQFQTPEDWNAERSLITSLDDWQYEQIYGTA